MKTKTNSFHQGIKAGLPIALGYFPIAVAFGVLAKNTGLSTVAAVLMSSMVFAGASQFVALNLLAIGTSYWQIIITTFILNLRHFLMSASLAQRLKPGKLAPLLAFGITDETFSVLSFQPAADNNPPFVLGVNTVAYLGWISGTFCGSLMGQELPALLRTSMGIALYAMFIGLLVPKIKASKAALCLTVLAIAVSSLLYWGPSPLSTLANGWKLMITTILVCTIGTLLFPEEVTEDE
ncbi:MAG: AzlC family ABC transporter permease [Firmicutes bacterium]|nr:AzlC family ABC transporter permease [Bacillota bacterium]